MNLNLLIISVVLLLFFFILAFLTSKKDKKVSWKDDVRLNLSKLILNSNEPLVLKNTLIELDKILDYSLKSRGVRGENLSDRLKYSSKEFNKKIYNDIWNAHKLRNKIVHEINYPIKKNDIQTASISLKDAINSLL